MTRDPASNSVMLLCDRPQITFSWRAMEGLNLPRPLAGRRDLAAHAFMQVCLETIFATRRRLREAGETPHPVYIVDVMALGETWSPLGLDLRLRTDDPYPDFPSPIRPGVDVRPLPQVYRAQGCAGACAFGLWLGLPAASASTLLDVGPFHEDDPARLHAVAGMLDRTSFFAWERAALGALDACARAMLGDWTGEADLLPALVLDLWRDLDQSHVALQADVLIQMEETTPAAA